MSLKYIGYSSKWSPLGIFTQAVPAELQQNEIIVDVSYLALNPIDIKLKSIAYAPFSWHVGKDFSGVIQSVGSAQTGNWKVGQRVCGGLTSQFNGIVGTKAVFDVTKQALMKTPQNLTDAQAAAFPLTFGTAYCMLSRTPKKGKLLVLGGASNVGTYAIQLAKQHFGFDEVVATCSGKSADFVRSIGADKTIDYHSNNVSQQLKNLNIKFDAIVDTVGGYDALRVWPDILKSNKEGGVYTTIAGDSSPSNSYKHALLVPTLKALPWAVPRMLFGKFLGINYQFVNVSSKGWVKMATEFFENNKITIPIDSEYPLSEYQKAWDHLENMQAHGKVLIKMTDE